MVLCLSDNLCLSPITACACVFTLHFDTEHHEETGWACGGEAQRADVFDTVGFRPAVREKGPETCLLIHNLSGPVNRGTEWKSGVQQSWRVPPRRRTPMVCRGPRPNGLRQDAQDLMPRPNAQQVIGRCAHQLNVCGLDQTIQKRQRGTLQ